MEIIPYDPACWTGIVEVHDAARLQELRCAGLEAAFLPLDIAAEREGLFDYNVYVAKNGEMVTGFVAFTDEELAWLYVHPAYQRQGIGRALAVYALSKMSAEEKCVEVLCGNESARNLYRNIGFTKEELLHGHMPGNEEFEVSAWRMTMK